MFAPRELPNTDSDGGSSREGRKSRRGVDGGASVVMERAVRQHSSSRRPLTAVPPTQSRLQQRTGRARTSPRGRRTKTCAVRLFQETDAPAPSTTVRGQSGATSSGGEGAGRASRATDAVAVNALRARAGHAAAAKKSFGFGRVSFVVPAGQAAAVAARRTPLKSSSSRAFPVLVNAGPAPAARARRGAQLVGIVLGGKEGERVGAAGKAANIQTRPPFVPVRISAPLTARFFPEMGRLHHEV